MASNPLPPDGDFVIISPALAGCLRRSVAGGFAALPQLRRGGTLRAARQGCACKDRRGLLYALNKFAATLAHRQTKHYATTIGPYDIREVVREVLADVETVPRLQGVSAEMAAHPLTGGKRKRPPVHWEEISIPPYSPPPPSEQMHWYPGPRMMEADEAIMQKEIDAFMTEQSAPVTLSGDEAAMNDYLNEYLSTSVQRYETFMGLGLDAGQFLLNLDSDAPVGASSPH